jgi:hypothetical protein
MASPISTNIPLTYTQWASQQTSIIQGVSEAAYVSYVKNWYKEQNIKQNTRSKSVKEDYIQLLKDLNFLFAQDEVDLFIKDIDYANEEDLILAIPFFAKKLTEISKVLGSKRESIKKAKSKYNMVGSNNGLEKLLYEYVLKTFTKKAGQATHVPALSIQSLFPELSSVKNDFYIQIEELHDPTTYHDSDPTVDVNQYLNVDDLSYFLPPALVEEIDENPLTEEQVLDLVTSRFLPRAANTPLLHIFKDYVAGISSTPSLSSKLTQQITNQILGSEKYLNETVYGITAVKLEEVLQPDSSFAVDLYTGSNWFMWPGGFQSLNNNVYNNKFERINLKDSNLIASGATGGTDLSNSDLIFTDRNGFVEGAWLQGTYTKPSTANVEMVLKDGETMEFLFPYVGFDISSKSLEFLNHSIKERNVKFFNALNTAQQEKILKAYYTVNQPNSASEPIYLNHTSLIFQGAYCGKFSDGADTIAKRQNVYEEDILPLTEEKSVKLPDVYSDTQKINTELAYLYKLDRTDLPIRAGDNYIYWPVTTFSNYDNISVNYESTDCLPIYLKDINTSYTMCGAVAGLTIETSDIIYKNDNRADNGSSSEAAWLKGAPLSALDVLKQDIPIYDKKYIKCADCLDGPVTSSASFKILPGQRVSFVWCGVDTYADEMFNFVEHSENCEYGKSYPHEYYSVQNYLNPVEIADRNYWKKCTCKSVHYSPIGHIGDTLTDYNGLTDCLYADPFGLGDNFTLTGWQDTRLKNYKDSPQFSFWHLNQISGDSPVGFGSGYWKTNSPLSKNRMVLKTGRRYTYYRTSLRKTSENIIGLQDVNSVPYFISNRRYKMADSVMDNNKTPVDVVIMIDASRSQTVDFENIKTAVSKICAKIIQDQDGQVQVGAIAFAENSIRVSYLTSNEYELGLAIENLTIAQEYPDYRTNLNISLNLAYNILTNFYPEDSYYDKVLSFERLCKDLNAQIANLSSLTNRINSPNSNAKKKIVIFSDGVVNIDEEIVLPYAQQLKSNGVEIFTVGLGELALHSELLDNVSTSFGTHFNLQRYLVSGDGDYDSFISYISRRILGSSNYIPTWYKAIRTPENGAWTAVDEVSDMVLRPGDYLTYTHRGEIYYEDISKGITFKQPSISFTINVKLDGWDYSTRTFSVSNVGPEYGAKPFWGGIPTDPYSIGGNIRFFDGYVPVHQPDVSNLILNSGDFIQYNHVGGKDLYWKQPMAFTVTYSAYNWNAIKTYKTYSNLHEFLKTDKIDFLIEKTYTPSDIVLESYADYKPIQFHYIARTPFTYQQDLYYRNRCLTNYVTFLSGVVIEPLEPHLNLTNKFYPTIATISFPEMAITEKQVGGYLLPENFGVSTYRGRGYTFSINQNSLSAIDAIGGERVFLDIEKYGPRNRGLTKNDQLSPVTLTDLNNKWIMEPFGSGSKAGVILGARENQKLVPYQAEYEILGQNSSGIARQEDSFEFWNFKDDGASWNSSGKTNYRKELLKGIYSDRINKLMVNKGTLTKWRNDIFGNDYGLYKILPPDPTDEVVRLYKEKPIVFNQSASNIEIYYDTRHTLFVACSGSEPFSYQWYKDGYLLKGANQSSYTIYKANTIDSGYYECVITNIVNRTYSKQVLLRVTEAANMGHPIWLTLENEGANYIDVSVAHLSSFNQWHKRDLRNSNITWSYDPISLPSTGASVSIRSLSAGKVLDVIYPNVPVPFSAATSTVRFTFENLPPSMPFIAKVYSFKYNEEAVINPS